MLFSHTMAVGSGEVIRPFLGLVFIPVGCCATFLTSREAGGGAGLDADHPSM